MYQLQRQKKLHVLNLLAEGSSIRSTERFTGVHRDTIMRLLVEAGNKCQDFLDEYMRNVPKDHWEIDEIWTFCRKKEGKLTEAEKAERIWGDQYLFLGIGMKTKLVPSFVIGKRDGAHAREFMLDLAQRLDLRYKHQLSTDGFDAYPNAVQKAFINTAVDYGVIIKHYREQLVEPGRYKPPGMVSLTRRVISGAIREDDICTSHVERNNGTIRTLIKRYTRLSLAFSKKLENLKAAVALHLANYNFCWFHKTLRQTPAQAAGLADCRWRFDELLEAVGVLKPEWDWC
jgi:IS1 family transposase